MNQYLIIKGDTNDADYITAINKISNEELAIIQPVIDAIVKFKKTHSWGHSWPEHEGSDKTSEELYKKLTEEQCEMFRQFIPYGEQHIHSIESIRLWQVADEKKLV